MPGSTAQRDAPMKRPRRAMKKPRKAARKTVARKRATKLPKLDRLQPQQRDAKVQRKIDPFYLNERLVPAGWAYQWKVKGEAVPPGWHCVPYSRHAHDFPRSANYQGSIVIKGLILMEALKDQVASELYASTRAAIEMDAEQKRRLVMTDRFDVGYSYPMMPESEVVAKVLRDAPPEEGPDIDTPISLLIRVPARWATAAAYLNLTVSEYVRRRVVAERMILGSMDDRNGGLEAIYRPVFLTISPSKEG